MEGEGEGEGGRDFGEEGDRDLVEVGEVECDLGLLFMWKFIGGIFYELS